VKSGVEWCAAADACALCMHAHFLPAALSFAAAHFAAAGVAADAVSRTALDVVQHAGEAAFHGRALGDVRTIAAGFRLRRCKRIRQNGRALREVRRGAADERGGGRTVPARAGFARGFELGGLALVGGARGRHERRTRRT
jgi:hypothetical protein